jgi:hypothetical protein
MLPVGYRKETSPDQSPGCAVNNAVRGDDMLSQICGGLFMVLVFVFFGYCIYTKQHPLDAFKTLYGKVK